MQSEAELSHVDNVCYTKDLTVKKSFHFFIFRPYFHYMEGKSFIQHSGCQLHDLTLCPHRRLVKEAGIGVDTECVRVVTRRWHVPGAEGICNFPNLTANLMSKSINYLGKNFGVFDIS